MYQNNSPWKEDLPTESKHSRPHQDSSGCISWALDDLLYILQFLYLRLPLMTPLNGAIGSWERSLTENFKTTDIFRTCSKIVGHCVEQDQVTFP